MNIAIALIVFFVLALICWGIAELNYKGFSYDIMRDNSTRGFNAVPSSPEDAK